MTSSAFLLLSRELCQNQCFDANTWIRLPSQDRRAALPKATRELQTASKNRHEEPSFSVSTECGGDGPGFAPAVEVAADATHSRNFKHYETR